MIWVTSIPDCRLGLQDLYAHVHSPIPPGAWEWRVLRTIVRRPRKFLGYSDDDLIGRSRRIGGGHMGPQRRQHSPSDNLPVYLGLDPKAIHREIRDADWFIPSCFFCPRDHSWNANFLTPHFRTSSATSDSSAAPTNSSRCCSGLAGLRKSATSPS
jgi:hypothetical protein